MRPHLLVDTGHFRLIGRRLQVQHRKLRALSLGCVAAAATGQTALGGAASSAALYYWGTP